VVPTSTIELNQEDPAMRHPVALSSALLAAAAFAWLPAAGETQTTGEKAKQKTEDAKSTTKEMTKEVKADVSDSWITAKTKMALFADDRVKGRQVSVETDKGVVALRGKVDSAESKAAAESVAQGIEGVKSVRNDLQVVPPGEQKAVAADDKEIKRTVETRLNSDPQLKKIDVRADAGVVTLTGEAPTITAAARASELAREAPGVRAVKNEMTYKDRSRSAMSRDQSRDMTRDSARREMRTAAGSDRVRAVQEALKTKGFDPGPIDGIQGPQTTQAVRDFQRAENLEVTGRPDSATLNKLGVEPGGRPQS
jgi:hyperosmotically inducible protein